MVRTCPRLACLRDSWRKFRRSWWKSWADRGGGHLPFRCPFCVFFFRRPFADKSVRATRAAGRVFALFLRRRRPERCLEPGAGQGFASEAEDGGSAREPTTRSTTSPSSLLRAARSSSVPKMPLEEPKGRRGFRPGQKVKHPKYGEGTVYQREGDGEDAKITVQFPRFGLKKLVERYAQLEKA